MLTSKEVSEMTGVSKATLHRFGNRGWIPFTVVKNCRRYDKSVIATIKSIRNRSRINKAKLRIPRERAHEILSQDDSVVIDDRERALDQGLPPSKPGKHMLSRDIITLRYARITPSYVIAVCAYLRLEVWEFMLMIGLKSDHFRRFIETYEPMRPQGLQISFQCGFFWVVKCLYAKGLIPYALARMGGVLDPVQEDKEFQCLKNLSEEGTKSPPKQGTEEATDHPWFRQLSADPRPEWL